MHKIINMGMIAVLSIGTITAGEIKGRVKYIGKSPKAKRIRMDADPVCAASHQEAAKAESFIVDADGNMANVIVYLKGVEYNGKTPSKEVIIDQKGCVYSPHVLGVQAGQPLKILNSDATMHNIHGLPKINKEFNFGMPKSLKQKTVTFNKAEDVFVIKCDVHPWMKSYTQVFDHPYFAVSGSDGSFSISNVPDGTYEAIAWQEKFGNKRIMTQSVTVKSGDAELNFSFERPKKK
jgi:plastocyanin